MKGVIQDITRNNLSPVNWVSKIKGHRVIEVSSFFEMLHLLANKRGKYLICIDGTLITNQWQSKSCESEFQQLPKTCR